LRVVIKKNPEGFSRVRTQAQALAITSGDFAGPVMVVFGQLHREQELAIFASQGARGGSGRWPALSPSYEKKKSRFRKAAGKGPGLVFAIGKKIMVLTGDTKARFTVPTNPAYVQRFVPRGTSGGVFQFGADSDVAAAHLAGNPSLAPHQSAAANRIFGGFAKRLPVRDVITKSAAQMAAFLPVLKKWYALRVQQVLKVRK
jgi:hypothetical protein